MLVVDAGLDSRERLRRAARLQRRDPRQRRDQDHAGLGLPPRVDDRRPVTADVLAIPDPRFRVDRLADRPEEPQRGEVVLLRVLGAPLHVRADRGGRGVEDRDAVAFDDLPPAVLAGEVRRPLVEDRGRAVAQRTVDDVAVAGDPPDVGGAPVDIRLGLQVEDVVVRRGDTAQVTGGRVHDPLRLRGGAARVHQEQQVLAVHRLARA